jgi:superfamily II DNA or RNA helicase
MQDEAAQTAAPPAGAREGQSGEKIFAPGARVVIRDEEWLVRSVDRSSDGGHLLTCDGVSELVRGQTALFLTALEDDIEVLDPASTLLVPDNSSSFDTSLLYMESQRRRLLPNDQLIRLGHRAVMNLVPYQLAPALQALRQPRCRILIADAVGLGKTLEAGILATELIQRGRGKRILVVTQKSMLTQFQKEFWSRFSIPLVRLDSVGLNRVRNRIPSNHNPFNHFDRSIISIDTLKNNLEYRNYLESAWWDIIVIDECHNVAARAAERGMSRRARLARLLATRSDTLILLSATPHDGSARSFASLMALLDPTAIADPDDYTPDDYRHKGLVIRRFKKDIRGQVTTEFKERVTTCLRQAASPQEEAAYRALLAIPFTQAGELKPGRQQELQRVGMQKAMFSSPNAALESTDRRIELITQKSASSAAEKNEVAALKNFADTLKAIDPSAFSKYQRLLKQLRGAEFGWTRDAADRLVIFSERIQTLEWLNVRLVADFGLQGSQIALMHGQLADTEQQELVDRFGRLDDPLRVLLCSDVASEGLNLHYFCHRLVHFDLPWSLMVFQQRNGRVDRYGQKREPQIVYLFTETQVEKIRGDLRILEILERKDEQANRNLGDPASFLNVYDPDKEADKVADFMAQGLSAEQVEKRLDAAQKGEEQGEKNEGDWLLKLFGGASTGEEAAAAVSAPQGSTAVSFTLFEDDYRFAKAALTQLSNPHPIAQWSGTDQTRTIAITPPLDLKERLRQLPDEAQPGAGQYLLCANPEKVAEAIERARQARKEEDTWPDLHYLWPQHPIMDWLVDRVLSAFGRQKAPVIRSPHLAASEQAYVLMGLIPNRKGQPLLVDWQVACRVGDGGFKLEPFESFAQRAKLKAGALPNPGAAMFDSSLQQDLPVAVNTMRDYMIDRQSTFSVDMSKRLKGTLADLAGLQAKQVEQLKLRLDKSDQAEHFKQSRFQQRSQQIHKVFDAYRQWVEDTMTTEPQPYIQMLAAVVG